MPEQSDQEKEFLAQQELQRQQIEAQMSMKDPYIRERTAQAQASIIRAIKPAEVLDEIERTLRGQVLDGEGNIIQKVEPLMTDSGVSTMISYCRTCLNQTIVISHISEQIVGKIMDQLGRDVVLSLQLNHRVWEINPKTNVDLICDLVLIPCFATLRRSCEGGERSFLKNMMSEVMSTRSGVPFQEKQGGIKGLMSHLKL